MTSKEAQDLIVEIYDENVELSDWELNFLESVGDRIDKEEPLSQKQMDKIHQIHKRVIDAARERD